MPIDTIRVNLIDDTIIFNKDNYFTPLLIFKATNLWHRGVIGLTSIGYREIIENIRAVSPGDIKKINEIEDIKEKLENERLDPNERKRLEGKHLAESSVPVGAKSQEIENSTYEKNFLFHSLSDFFDENATKSASLLIYNDKKEVKEFLEKNNYTFVVFLVNDAEEIKDDFDTIIKGVESFFLLQTTKDSELPSFLKTKGKEELRNIILVYNNRDNLYLKFISKYLHQASNYISVNPYGIRVKSRPLTDSSLRQNLRDKNINFYSLLNETGRDGVEGLKEGKDLSGKPIDLIFSLYYIKNEAIKELIRVWNRNNRQNSKLSEMQASGERMNAYIASLECFFKDLEDRRIIVDYRDIKVRVERSSNDLKLDARVKITYNYSVNEVILSIQSEDVGNYLRRAS